MPLVYFECASTATDVPVFEKQPENQTYSGYILISIVVNCIHPSALIYLVPTDYRLLLLRNEDSENEK
jgi:hypothetical protein